LVRARLADLVWLKARKRGIRYALLAIDAYRRAQVADRQAAMWVLVADCWVAQPRLETEARITSKRFVERAIASFAPAATYRVLRDSEVNDPAAWGTLVGRVLLALYELSLEGPGKRGQ
jgi:hypothetical protein